MCISIKHFVDEKKKMKKKIALCGKQKILKSEIQEHKEKLMFKHKLLHRVLINSLYKNPDKMSKLVELLKDELDQVKVTHRHLMCIKYKLIHVLELYEFDCYFRRHYKHQRSKITELLKEEFEYIDSEEKSYDEYMNRVFCDYEIIDDDDYDTNNDTNNNTNDE